MARVSTWTWVSIAAGLTMQAAPVRAAMPPVLAGAAGVVAQSAPRPAGVHGALNSGIDCYRRADYELAASFFQQAQDGKVELSADEQQELSNLLRLNTAALKARRDGGEQLSQAEKALRAGRSADAEAILKTATTNQFLTAGDKIKAHQLSEQLRVGGLAKTGVRSTGGVNPAVLARTKLQQGRLLMSKANYDAADALAREVELLKVSYSPGEDTPQKLLEDVSRARTDAKGLMTAARSAMQAGDLDRAEGLARAAESADSGWAITHLWGDSPAKVLKDVQAARARSGSTTVTQSAKAPNSQVISSRELSPTDAAHQLVKQGRKALQRGDLDEAKQCVDQAQSLRVDFHWWEDNPNKLQTDIQRTSDHGRRATKDRPRTSLLGPLGMPSASDESARSALLNGRSLLNAGKIDDAEKLALKLRSESDTSWGLFEDTPDKLLTDIQKGRTRRELDQSGQLMAEARKQMTQGNWEAAKAAAYKAERLHGPYSVWEVSDRPEKLIAEISAAQAKARKPGSSTPLSAVAQNAAKSASPTMAPASMDADKSAPTNEKKPTEVVQASAKEAAVASMPSAAAPSGFDPTAGQPSKLPNMLPTNVPAAPVDPVKQKAQQLMAEARQCQKDGHLVEARQKVLEAQKTGAISAADEDRPERMLLQFAGLASKHIEFLVQKATDFAATGHADAARFQTAENDLAQAHELAVGFALDTQTIDAKSAWVRRTRDQALKASVAHVDVATPYAAVPAPPSAPKDVASPPIMAQPGQELLEKARLELNRGDLQTARRLAEEVYAGPYGLQKQADGVLHSIDAEEFNQRVLTANRSFDAAAAAFYRKDFSQAGTMFRSLDMALLTPEKQAKVHDILLVPEMQPRSLTPASATFIASPEAGRASASDLPPSPRSTTPEEGYARQFQALQEVEFQKLRDDGLRAQREATERFRAGEQDQALEILQQYLDGLRESRLEPDKLALLQRPAEARLQLLKTERSRQDFAKAQAGQHESFTQVKTREAKLEEHKHQQVEDLMKQYHEHYRDGKYADAEMAARRALELDPDNAAAGAAVSIAHLHRNQTEYSRIKDAKEEMVLKGLNDAGDEGPAVSASHPLEIDKGRTEIARARKVLPHDGLTATLKSEKEREIERRLSLPITLDFKDTPLKQVLDDIRDFTGINIVPDGPALEEENISLDRLVTLHVEGVAAKSALNLLLHQAHLIYILRDEVLQITTEAHARGTLVSKVYQVADLIIPVDNKTLPPNMDLVKVLAQCGVSTPGTLLSPGNSTPSTAGKTLSGGTQVGATTPTPGTSDPTPAPGESRTPGQTLEESLMRLIQSTIKPESWKDMGGTGTVNYYPLGMALVVSQTPDIQEQVAELLGALRRLQDIQVTVEVRFITIDESFYERIGLDFNLNIVTQNPRNESLLLSQQFRPFGFNNAFTPNGYVFGLEPGGARSPAPGVPTPDLNIPLLNSSNAGAIPPFGGFPNQPGFDGGLSLGLAFLSDIQVFMFLEAAQGDRRTNVMQAPKLTLFNGQNANINVTTSQFFVTNVVVALVAGQVVFVPSNTPFPTGVTLNVQAVVSADRRFVRMTLAPTINTLGSPGAGLFPITTFITPSFENGSVGLPIPFTQFLQQPILNTVAVNTTVNVPDGGTVLLGGLKTLREGRNEYGPPILSKLPYLNRLFKNVGYGRDTESLLLMVTPRVIINEEEEIRQTGVSEIIGQQGPAPGPGR